MSTKIFGLELAKTQKSITNAFSFWADAVRLSLPRSIRSKFTVGKEQVIVHLNQDNLHVIEHQNNQTFDWGTFDFDHDLFDTAVIDTLKKQADTDKELILAVSEQQILSKKVDFPLAVADNLKQTLLYEMDKHTPFPKEQVLYDTQITGEHAGKVLAQLYILHKPIVSSLLNSFKDSNIYFDRLSTADNQEINLLPDTLKRKKGFRNINRNFSLSLIGGILVILALATPLVLKRHTAITLDKQIATLLPQAEGEIELWEHRDQSEEALLSFLETHPLSFSQIYEALSKRLPDHTYLSSFDFRRGQITITGESADAASLIAMINKSPFFKDARFLSPIVKSRDSNKEIYRIHFKLISGGA